MPVRERRASLSVGRHADGRLGCRCACPAGTVLQANERGIPIGEIAVEGTDYDFRQRRPIGATLPRPLLHRSRARRRRDRCAVTLQDADGAGPSLWMDEALPLPDAVHRRPAARRRPPQPRRRADDVPAERLPDGTGSDPPGPVASRSPAGGASTPRNSDACTLGRARRSRRSVATVCRWPPLSSPASQGDDPAAGTQPADVLVVFGITGDLAQGDDLPVAVRARAPRPAGLPDRRRGGRRLDGRRPAQARP